MSNHIFDNEVASKVAAQLLEIKAVKFNTQSPFTWASGWKSPIYCDNRITLSFPDIRIYIKKQMQLMVSHKFSGVEAIVGVATAGIPQAVLVAQELDLPFAYVRSKAKGHGMTNQIEGKLDQRQKVVLIEDLISTGGSSLNAVKALRDSSIEVLGLAAIFSYDFKLAQENFIAAKVNHWCLSNYPILIEQALKQNYIHSSQLESLQKWRMSPETWG
ncbi:MAG: orotate phosphoribosyltransferase [Bacteroidetes bacterium]|nr:orotate phosphoribosyltransferase [Bacteroidota bacterium]